MTNIPTISPALAAQELNVSQSTIRSYIKRGLLSVTKEGVYSRIDPRDLEKLRGRKAGRPSKKSGEV